MSLQLFSLATPAVTTGLDTSNINLGMTFSVNVNGQINGIYFYKIASDTATHVVGLFPYSTGSSHTALASITVTNETASGWQYMAFASPVSVTAGTQYVAVVYYPTGRYSYTNNAFPASVNRISAPANSASVPNGAYVGNANGLRYPATPLANRWFGLDVDFTTSANMLPPTANAGTDQTVAGGDLVTLDGSASTAVSPATVGTYIWTQISGPVAATLSSTSAQKPTFTAPAANGTLVFGLKVQDSDTIISSQATVNVTIHTPPTASAGHDQIVDFGVPVTLDGSGSSAAPTATLTSYSWTQLSGPSVSLSSTTVAQPSFTSPTSPATLVFGLTITDSIGNTSAQSTVTITVEHCLSLLYPATPTTTSASTTKIVVGMLFSTNSAGQINGLYFYKGANNTGTHIIGLYLQSSQALLASATVANETASGWQYQAFASPVAISANTNYMAAVYCPNGSYSYTQNTFLSSSVTANRITAPANSAGTPNGAYVTGSTGIKYPSSSPGSGNAYALDVNFTISGNMDPPVPNAGPDQIVGGNLTVTLDGTASVATSPATVAGYKWSQVSGPAVTLSSTTAAQPTFTSPNFDTTLVFGLTVSDSNTLVSTIQDTVTITVQLAPTANAGADLIANYSDVVTLDGSASTAVSPATIASYHWTQLSGPAMTLSSSSAQKPTFTAPATKATMTFGLTVTDSNAQVSSQSVVTVSVGQLMSGLNLFYPSVPAIIDSKDTASYTTGVQFFVTFTGRINGVWFYKASTNTGTHIAALYTSTGTLLAQAPYTNETASGWQYQAFDSYVPVAANTTYVAAVFMPNGHYSTTKSVFANQAVAAHMITAPQSTSTTPNGVYVLSTSLKFPTVSFGAVNYFIDVNYATLNAPPIANSGPTQTANAYQTVSLNGTTSMALGQVTGYSWRQVSGPAVTLSSTTAAQPTFVAPAGNGGVTSTLTFGLTVTDDQSQTSPESQTTVNVNSAGFFMLIGGVWTPRQRFSLRDGSWQ